MIALAAIQMTKQKVKGIGFFLFPFTKEPTLANLYDDNIYNSLPLIQVYY